MKKKIEHKVTFELDVKADQWTGVVQILWGKERIPQGKRSGVYQGTEFCEGTKCLGLVLNSGFSEQFLGRKVDQGKIYMGFSYVVHTKQKLFHRQWCTRNIFFKILSITLYFFLCLYIIAGCAEAYTRQETEVLSWFISLCIT